MVRDSLFLYKNIKIKILQNISPIFHPTKASDYFIFNNNLSDNGSFVAYDSSSSTVKWPTVFEYKLKGNNNPYGLKLNKVVFNGDIGTREDSPALPQTSGKITLSKFAALEDTIPSVHLYFQGTIQYKISWDCDYPEGVWYETYTARLSPKTFPSDKKITVNYSYTDRYIEPNYSYTGDTVTITCNWNNQRFVKSVANYGTGTEIQFSAPTESILNNKNIIPTIYINNWVGSDYNPGGGETTNKYIANVSAYLREEPVDGSNIVGGINAGDEAESDGIIEYGENRNWLYITVLTGYFTGNSGWIDASLIRKK